MAKLTISKETAEKIVELGTAQKTTNVKSSYTTTKTNGYVPTGHLTGRIFSSVSEWSEDYVDDSIDNSSNQYIVEVGIDLFHVFSPIIYDVIPRLTKVMIQRNMSNGHWEIIATEPFEKSS